MSRGIGKLQYHILKLLQEKKQQLRPKDLILSLSPEATKTKNNEVRHNVYVALKGLVSKGFITKEGHHYAITHKGKDELLYFLLYRLSSPNLNEILNLSYGPSEIGFWPEGRKLLYSVGIVR